MVIVIMNFSVWLYIVFECFVSGVAGSNKPLGVYTDILVYCEITRVLLLMILQVFYYLLHMYIHIAAFSNTSQCSNIFNQYYYYQYYYLKFRTAGISPI